jgi:hypothetical protein
VLCKTNIGSCGFKKKVKYTGYAIKRTSKIFLEKIIKSLVYNVYNTYYIDSLKKKKKKIKEKLINYIFNQNKLKFIKNKKNYYIKNLNLKKRIKIKNFDNILIKNINKKQGLRKIKKKKEINLKFLEFKKLNLNIYRNYDKYLKNFLKKKLKITLRIKSNLKF